MGIAGGLLLFASDNQIGLQVIGAVIIVGTSLWLFNYFSPSRVCVDPSVVRQVDWLGYVVKEIPLKGIRSIDLGTGPGYILPAELVEITSPDIRLALNMRLYDDHGLHRILSRIREYQPEAPFSARAREYLDNSGG